MTPPIFGITGWKNSGKTTLLVSLVEEFISRGFVISTIKHSSSHLQFDKSGTDSFRHQQSGATQTALITDNKWILQTSGSQVSLVDMVSRLDSCDLVLAEGFKSESHPKLECLSDNSPSPIHTTNKTIVALSCDDSTMSLNHSLPHFSRIDITGIANFIISHLGLSE